MIYIPYNEDVIHCERNGMYECNAWSINDLLQMRIDLVTRQRESSVLLPVKAARRSVREKAFEARIDIRDYRPVM